MGRIFFSLQVLPSLPGVEGLFGICNLPFANSGDKRRKGGKIKRLPTLPPGGQSPTSLPFTPGGRKPILAHEIPHLRG